MSMGIGAGMSAIIGQGMDIMTEKRADARQKKAEARSEQRERNMAHMYDQYARDKFEYTGYGAQADQLRKAGMNIGLMYGQAGQGGQASATTASSTQSQPNVQNNTAQYMGIGQQQEALQSQIELTKAQAQKTQAETENIQGGVRENLTEDSRGKKFDNDINEKYKDMIEETRYASWESMQIDAEEKNAAWEFKKAIDYGGRDQEEKTRGVGMFSSETSRKGRARIAELDMIKEDLKKAKTQNNIMEAEEIIKEFEAEMTKAGISPNSPWYAKLVTDLLEKVGFLDIIKMGQKGIKNEVQK